MPENPILMERLERLLSSTVISLVLVGVLVGNAYLYTMVGYPAILEIPGFILLLRSSEANRHPGFPAAS